MERFENVGGTWHRPRLNLNDVPSEFVEWWKKVPQERRPSYLHGGMYPMVVAFKNGQQVEALRRQQQIELLTQALDATLAFVQDSDSPPPARNEELRKAVCQALAALDRTLEAQSISDSAIPAAPAISGTGRGSRQAR